MTTPAEMPLVTIGLPTFNRAATTLPLALASAVGQTYPAVEIVVADNASTDATREVVQALHDPRIRYLRHDRNRTANENFNFCLGQAQGAYFLLFHDDDLIDPDFVETCMRAASGKVDAGIIRTGIRVISQQGAVTREIPNRAAGSGLSDFVRAWFAHETSPYCCNTLLNTQALREAGGFRSRHLLFQDVMAHVRVAATRRTVNVYEVKASVRRHEGNMGLAARINDWCDDSRELLDTICELLPDQARQLRKDGERFFAHMNYLRVLQLNSMFARANAYRTVARSFHCAGSPLHFIFRHDVRPKLRALKRKLQYRMASASS
jgi:glycosyltransferase involved in cell wall biosynthesis